MHLLTPDCNKNVYISIKVHGGKLSLGKFFALKKNRKEILFFTFLKMSLKENLYIYMFDSTHILDTDLFG